VVLILEKNLAEILGTLLLWVLCSVGWLYLLKIIRLRQAWHHSARAMNKIKAFYISRSKDIDVRELSEAFLWKNSTLPAPEKRWTVFFYSACLIGILNSVAFWSGGLLLAMAKTDADLIIVGIGTALLAVFFFSLHIWLYSSLLKKGTA